MEHCAVTDPRRTGRCCKRTDTPETLPHPLDDEQNTRFQVDWQALVESLVKKA
jgi:hypothetical protein